MAPRVLWYLPVVHQVADIGPKNNAKVREALVYLHGPDEAEVLTLRLQKAWQEAAREVFRLVAAFGHPSRIHLFVDSVIEPLELLRPTYERLAKNGSVMCRIMLGLEQMGCQLHAADNRAAVLAQYDIMSSGDSSSEAALRSRLLLSVRDELIAVKVAFDVPDGHVALVMMGAAHGTEQRIRRYAPDFQVIRIGTMDALYGKMMQRP